MKMYKKSSLQSECLTNIKGLYYLYNINKDLIYVGRSINCVRARLRTHLISDLNYLSFKALVKAFLMRKETAYFSFEPVNTSSIKAIEKDIISRKCPKYNLEFNSNFDKSIIENSNFTEVEKLYLDMAYEQLESPLQLWKFNELQRIRQKEIDDIFDAM